MNNLKSSAENGLTIISRRSNTLVLSIAQGLFTAALAVDLTLTGLTGYQLAPSKSLATLPFAIITASGAVTTMLASKLIEKWGRRFAFSMGATICAIGGFISVWAILHAAFWMFCVGTAAVGIFQSFAQFYPLAAADSVPVESKARAVSTVMAGGVIAAVLGPILAAWSKSLLPVMFAGSYLMVAVLGICSAMLIITAFHETNSVDNGTATSDRPARNLRTIFSHPVSQAALANNVIGGAIMMLIMTAAPLAAVESRHSIDDGASIIQWHLVGMYAPALFAGRMISRLGMPAILFAGMALTAACVAIVTQSTDLQAFYAALLCLGIGWNFMSVGGTTLLASSYRPNERASVQGIATLIRYGFMAFAALIAGPLLQYIGWKELNLLTLPLLLIAAIMTWTWVKSGQKLID